MFIRLGQVRAASETAEISKLRRIYEEYKIVALAVEELGINLLPFQVDALACVCSWLSSSSLVLHVSWWVTHILLSATPLLFTFWVCASLSLLFVTLALVVSLPLLLLPSRPPACASLLSPLCTHVPLVSTTNLSSLHVLLVVAFLSPWLLLSCASLGTCASLHLLMVFLFLFALVVSAFVLATSLLSPLHVLWLFPSYWCHTEVCWFEWSLVVYLDCMCFSLVVSFWIRVSFFSFLNCLCLPCCYFESTLACTCTPWLFSCCYSLLPHAHFSCCLFVNLCLFSLCCSCLRLFCTFFSPPGGCCCRSCVYVSILSRPLVPWPAYLSSYCCFVVVMYAALSVVACYPCCMRVSLVTVPVVCVNGSLLFSLVVHTCLA